MSVKYLKNSLSEASRSAEDQKVKKSVEEILALIDLNGDKSVLELSKKFDNYAPKSFRLSDQDIENAMSQVSKRDLEDIKYAQNQIRSFAVAQRDSMKDIEVETQPGVILGHKNIPVQSVGCYVPGGKFPMVASAHSKRCRSAKNCCISTAPRRQTPSGDCGSHASWRCP